MNATLKLSYSTVCDLLLAHVRKATGKEPTSFKAVYQGDYEDREFDGFEFTIELKGDQ